MGCDPGVYVSNCYLDNLGDTVKHKHCEVIKAWADGERIEVSSPTNGEWRDCPDPSWFLDKLYRVKPETVRYRLALMSGRIGGNYAVTANDEDEANGLATHAGAFNRWLTDWQEVEV